MLNQTMENEKPLIVLVGLGQIGMIHAKNLAKVRQIRLGLASGRPDILKQVASSLHADRTYSSLQEALTDTEVNAVVLATSISIHASQIIAAAKAGKHVFCEKPLGNNIEEVEAIQKAVTEAGIRFMTGFQRRWDPAYAAAKKRIESGELGKPVVFKCTSGDPLYPHKFDEPDHGAEYAIFRDVGVHDIDLARWLTDSEVASVYAYCDSFTFPELTKGKDGDNAMGVMHMQNGAIVLFHSSLTLCYGYNTSGEFVGTKGTVRMGDLNRIDLAEAKDKKLSVPVAWHYGERFEKALENEIFAFADLVRASDEEAAALVKGDNRYASVTDGVMATKVAEATVRSYKMKAAVEVVYE